MIDQILRARLAPTLDRAADTLETRGVAPGALTALALAAGLAACVAAAWSAWGLALALWLLNRVLDGLDGPLARRGEATELGGLLDFVSDFVVYSGFVVAVAIARPGLASGVRRAAGHLPGQQRGAALVLVGERATGPRPGR